MESSAELLLHIEKAIVLDSSIVIHRLQMDYSHFFTEPEPGIYNQRFMDPIIVANKTYYHPTARLEPVRFEEPAPNQGPPVQLLVNYPKGLVDEDGMYVVNPLEIKNYKKLLSNAPFYPKAPHFVLINLCQEIISRNVKHSKFPGRGLHLPYKYRDYLTPQGEEACGKGEIEDICSFVLDTVEEFVLEKPWSIYFVNTIGRDIIVERSVDYRVYDWTDRMIADQEDH